MCVAFSVAVFIIYLVVLVAIGVITYLRTKSYSDYNLAGRSNNKWVTAISAESSDMSGWLLMGLPGAAYASGFSSIWIIIGLIFGTMFNWIFVANRLRIASESYGAFSITEYFEKRVNDKKGIVALVSGIAIIVIMIINSSAEIIGSGKLLNATFGLDYNIGIIVGLVIVMLYTFLGGYMAVSWSNLFQGTIMFFALLLVPAAALLCTAAEYLMGLFYEKVTLVSFWDYSHLRGNVGGKICPAFSAAWGVLAAVVAYLIHPVVARLVPLIPPAVTVTTALALSADSLLSVVLLRRARSAQVLRWYDRLPHPFRPVRT